MWRKIVICGFVVLLFVAQTARPEDGKILEKEPFKVSKQVMIQLAQRGGDYSYVEDINMYDITYSSDGLRVKGFLLVPKSKGIYPCVIFNRGGNREFGAISDSLVINLLARISSWGYVVVASQYRGNAGGEGREEFGGADVNDVLNLIPLLESQLKADATRIGMFGWSRGGMMTYIALKRSTRISAAVVGGGLSDLTSSGERRPDMERNVFRQLIPNYDQNKEAALRARSAVYWAGRLCKTSPILLLHGTADWRAVPEMVLDLSKALLDVKHPFRLVLFEGADHGISEYPDEVRRQAREWLDRFVRDKKPLPNMEPHD